MKHIILYLFSALLMAEAVNDKEEKEKALEPFILHYAIRLDCDKYKVFYTEGETWKSKKEKLPELIKMGFDANDIVILTSK